MKAIQGTAVIFVVVVVFFLFSPHYYDTLLYGKVVLR